MAHDLLRNASDGVHVLGSDGRLVYSGEEFDFLVEAGCDAFQGYLLARPEAVEAFEARVTALAHA